MKCTCVASIVLAASVSALFGCTSAEKVVAANLQSSNDNQYNPTTDNGKLGGLIQPGIPDRILNPDSATPDELRAATKVRITLSQTGATDIQREVLPKTKSWSFDVLDADGAPAVDEAGNPVKEEHLGIDMFFERIPLTDSWKGEASAKAEAIDDAGNVLLSASVPFTVEENGAVYVPIDLKIPTPLPPSGEGGAGGEGGTGGEGGEGNTAGAAGEAGAGDGGTAGQGGEGGTAGTAGASS